jgi:hypothetical protein
MESQTIAQTHMDDVYMQIWQVEQKYVETRWNITAFFLGISFAVLGFSFQAALHPSQSFAVRLCGLLVYCFACVMYRHHSTHAYCLRSYLLDMEAAGHTTLDVESRVAKGRGPRDHRLVTTQSLLVGFGLVYLAGIGILLILHF